MEHTIPPQRSLDGIHILSIILHIFLFIGSIYYILLNNAISRTTSLTPFLFIEIMVWFTLYITLIFFYQNKYKQAIIIPLMAVLLFFYIPRFLLYNTPFQYILLLFFDVLMYLFPLFIITSLYGIWTKKKEAIYLQLTVYVITFPIFFSIIKELFSISYQPIILFPMILTIITLLLITLIMIYYLIRKKQIKSDSPQYIHNHTTPKNEPIQQENISSKNTLHAFLQTLLYTYGHVIFFLVTPIILVLLQKNQISDYEIVIIVYGIAIIPSIILYSILAYLHKPLSNKIRISIILHYISIYIAFIPFFIKLDYYDMGSILLLSVIAIPTWILSHLLSWILLILETLSPAQKKTYIYPWSALLSICIHIILVIIPITMYICLSVMSLFNTGVLVEFFSFFIIPFIVLSIGTIFYIYIAKKISTPQTILLGFLLLAFASLYIFFITKDTAFSLNMRTWYTTLSSIIILAYFVFPFIIASSLYHLLKRTSQAIYFELIVYTFLLLTLITPIIMRIFNITTITRHTHLDSLVFIPFILAILYILYSSFNNTPKIKNPST